MGNWTALSLREMGLSVFLIDQYSPGNSKSSSKGEIRGMRLTYGDNEHEMLWARDACEQWKIRQSEFGTDMFYQCGALSFRREWTARNTAERALFDKHEVPYEVIPYADLVRRWPQAPPPSEEYFGFYHPWGGVLSPRDANLAVATSFKSKGGRVILGKAMPGARAGGKLETVTLSSGETVSAGSFVFAVGAWLPKVFPVLMKDKLSVAESRVLHVRHATWRHPLLRPEPPEHRTRPAEHQRRRLWIVDKSHIPGRPRLVRALAGRGRTSRGPADSGRTLSSAQGPADHRWRGHVRPRTPSMDSASSISIRR